MQTNGNLGVKGHIFFALCGAHPGLWPSLAFLFRCLHFFLKDHNAACTTALYDTAGPSFFCLRGIVCVFFLRLCLFCLFDHSFFCFSNLVLTRSRVVCVTAWCSGKTFRSSKCQCGSIPGAGNFYCTDFSLTSGRPISFTQAN